MGSMNRHRVLVAALAVLALAACSREEPQGQTPDRPGLPRPSRASGTAPGGSIDQPVPPSEPSRQIPAPPDDGSDDITEVTAALADAMHSSFSVRYRVDGAAYFDAATLGWNDPWARWDAMIYNSDVTAYYQATTAKLTVCVTVLGKTDCDSDRASTQGEAYQVLLALEPSGYEEIFDATLSVPGTKVSYRTIADRKAVCATSAGAELCADRKTGAVLLSDPVPGFPTVSVKAKSVVTPVSAASVKP